MEQFKEVVLGKINELEAMSQGRMNEVGSSSRTPDTPVHYPGSVVRLRGELEQPVLGEGRTVEILRRGEVNEKVQVMQTVPIFPPVTSNAYLPPGMIGPRMEPMFLVPPAPHQECSHFYNLSLSHL